MRTNNVVFLVLLLFSVGRVGSSVVLRRNGLSSLLGLSDDLPMLRDRGDRVDSTSYVGMSEDRHLNLETETRKSRGNRVDSTSYVGMSEDRHLNFETETRKSRQVFRRGDRVDVMNDATSYVDVFVGTMNQGHTFPGATAPFGMIQVSPINTVSSVSTTGYTNDGTRFFGFVHTCLSGTGIADGLDVLVLPSSNSLVDDTFTEGIQTLSQFISRLQYETIRRDAEPGRYSTTVENEKHMKIDMDVVALERHAVHRWRSRSSKELSIVVDLRNRFSWDNVLPGTKIVVHDSRTLSGKRCTSGWAKHTCVYFVIRFKQNEINCRNGESYSRDEMKIMLCKFTKTSEVEFSVGLSYVSVQGALRNIGEEEYNIAREKSHKSWIRILERFTGRSRTIMTALYHTLLGPTLISDVDGKSLDPDGIVRERKHNTYSSFSLWDTYRSEMSLLQLLLPKYQTYEMIESLKSFAKTNPPTYTLPLFDLYREDTQTMIGYPAVSVLASYVLLGNITNIYAKNILTLLKRTATSRHSLETQFISKLTYIPSDVVEESVSKALEMASSDDCISRLARFVSHDQNLDDELRDAAHEIESHFQKRSRLYELYFHDGYFQPRLSNGSFRDDFDFLDASAKNGFTEANAFQYLFSVVHDVPGLSRLLGGKDMLSKRLDEFFSLNSRPHTHDRELPKDVSASMLGGATIGNEPSLHIPLLYNYVGEPWKAQSLMHRILTTMFSDNPDGLPGNDDFGAMSSFYFFNAALGIYPVHPCSGEYQISRPLVHDVTLHLGDSSSNNTFRVQVLNQSLTDNMYVQDVWLNDQRLNRTFILHKEIVRCCEKTVLKFLMGPTPNYDALR